MDRGGGAVPRPHAAVAGAAASRDAAGYLIIDLLAIAPFYLGGLLGLDLRVLRVLRLLRFFKLSRYSPAMHTLLRVLQNEQRSLMGAGPAAGRRAAAQRRPACTTSRAPPSPTSSAPCRRPPTGP